MFGKGFQLNEATLSVVEELGRHMPGGFFIYKEEQPEELIYVNKATLNIFGCATLEEFKALTGWTFRGMLHPDDYAAISASIVNQIGKSDEALDYVEYRIIRRDGAVRWVDDYGHYTRTEAYGGVYYVFISDITEKRLRVESDLAVRQAVIEALSESYNTVGLIDVESGTFSLYRGDREEIDARAASIRDEMGRLSYARALSCCIEADADPADRERLRREVALETIVARLKTRPQYAVSFLRRMGDGIERYFRIEFAKVNMPGGRLGIVCGFKDVDAETRDSMAQTRALAEALAAAENANRAKTAFLSNMSHEIRTPMNAIIGLNNIALNSPNLPGDTREYLEKIGASAQHLLSIINDILDMTRIESGRMTLHNGEFSFSRALEQVNTIIGGQCREKGLEYECRIVGKIDDYYIGDDMKLRQVMINILGNAVKFTLPGGKVTFVVEEGPRFDGRATLRFIISDTGIGVSPEFLPKLFDTFSQEDSSTTSRYGSTGLGLPITKSLVEMMNGQISVESEKGVGTTFTVTVTLAECDHRDAGEDEGAPRPQEMAVLVIDDDPVACGHAQVVLGQVGVSCDTARSGEEGLEMVRVRHARREPYNLILVDWKMPGMDGVQTTRMIRNIVGHESAIIILTSYNWDDVAEEAARAGVDTFVSKPLFAGSVLDEFREAFKRKNMAAGSRRTDLKNRRVLLAEDVAVNAEIMTMVLAMREIEVEQAENGQVAVELFAAHEPGYYDAILMDMRMPVMDGLEATKTIRAMNRPDAKTIPIVALTANAFDEDVQRSMQAGLNAHLSKPVQPETLFGTLESLIAG